MWFENLPKGNANLQADFEQNGSARYLLDTGTSNIQGLFDTMRITQAEYSHCEPG